MDARAVGVICATASGAAWAVGAILYKRACENVSASSLNLIKGVLGLAVLGAVWLLLGPRPMDGVSFLWLAASGVLGIAIGDTFFFKALQLLDAHLLVLLMMAGQALTVLLAVVLLGERPSAAAWAGILLTTAGVTLAMWPGPRPKGKPSSAAGVIYGLLSVACMSLAMIVTKRAIVSVPALQATVIRIAAGAAGLGVFGLAAGRLGEWLSPLRDLRWVGKIFAAVCVATLGGFWLSHVAIKNIDVSIANPLISLEPIFVLPLAAIFLGEKVTSRAVAGAVIGVGGVALLSLGYKP